VHSVTPRPCFTPEIVNPSTHYKEVRVGLRYDLEARGKILYLCRGSKPVIQSILRHYTQGG
jgi:hypothetical protein